MADPNKIELLLEAERRGILPPEKKTLLDEARKRGLIGGTSEQKLVSASSDPEEETQDTSGDIKSKIDSIVSKSVLNPSENLKIDPSDVENFKKNPYAGVNLKEKDQDITTLEDGNQIKSPLNKTRLLNAADTYTAGLGIKGGALIDALVNKIQGQNSMGLEPSVVDEVDNRDEFGQIYDDSLKDFRAKMKEQNKQNPADALIGQIGGLVAPMGAFSNATKAASAIPFISKLLKSTKNVVDGGKIVAKPAILKMLLGQALRGGTANALFGQVNQDLDASGGDRLKKGLTDFGVGAAFDAGPSAIWQGLKGTGKGFWNGIVGAKNVGKKIGDTVTGGLFSKRQAKNILGKVDDFTLETTGATSSRQAGEKSISDFNKITDAASKSYNELNQANLSKFGNQVVNPKNLTEGFENIFKDAGLMDNAGNFKESSILKEFDARGAPFFKDIAKKLKTLKENPVTYSDLSEIVKDLGELSKFSKSIGSSKTKQFKNLFFMARDDLINSIDDLTVKAGGTAAEGEAAKKTLDEARKTISKNIDISQGPIGSLLDQAPEKAISGAKKNLLGSDIDEALAVDPNFREPIKTLIIGDLKKSLEGKLQKIRGSKATNSGVEALESIQDNALDIINNYTPETLRKLFSPEEMAFFEKLAGTYKKQPGNMQKSGAYILKLLKGAPVAPLVSNQNR